jgi:hypothetical protein
LRSNRAFQLIHALLISFAQRFHNSSFKIHILQKENPKMKNNPKSSPRKRGAQPGNKNAFRHGFYSKSFTETEMQSLDENVKGEFHDEIAVARIQASHLAELLMDYKKMPFENFVAGSNALNNYLDRIQSLTRNQRFIYQNQTTIEKAIEELKDIPPEED